MKGTVLDGAWNRGISGGRVEPVTSITGLPPVTVRR